LSSADLSTSTVITNNPESSALAERFAVADGDPVDGGSPNLTPIGRRHD
jgi:hypothetical protein